MEMEDREKSMVSPIIDESDRFEVFCEPDDVLDMSVASEASPGRRGGEIPSSEHSADVRLNPLCSQSLTLLELRRQSALYVGNRTY